MGKQPTERTIVNVSKKVYDSLTGLMERIITYGTHEIESIGVKAPRSIYTGKMTLSDIIALAIVGYYGLLRRKGIERKIIGDFAKHLYYNEKISEEVLNIFETELKTYIIRGD